MKRLPRYDRTSLDLLGIKSQLSKYGNSVYDQVWIENGSPENIKIVDLDLEGSDYFRDIVYGTHSDVKFDGIHLAGVAANLQFT